jgi:hypothetical protein
MLLLGVALAPGSATHGVNLGTRVLPLDGCPLPDGTVHALIVLNDDPGVRSVIAVRLDHHSDDIAVYYLNALDRVLPPQYVPTDEDIIRAHVSTKGVRYTADTASVVQHGLQDILLQNHLRACNISVFRS